MTSEEEEKEGKKGIILRGKGDKRGGFLRPPFDRRPRLERIDQYEGKGEEKKDDWQFYGPRSRGQKNSAQDPCCKTHFYLKNGGEGKGKGKFREASPPK